MHLPGRPLRTLFRSDVREDPRRCRVCGHLTVRPARRVLNVILLIIIGALLMYITLDVAENGRIDASISRYIQSPASQPRRSAATGHRGRRGTSRPARARRTRC
jgi:hypothetical protein